MNLREIWLITNYSCNNRCKWCYTKSTGFSSDIMPLQFAKEVLFEISKCGIAKCTLIGGEPLLYPSVYELLEYGSSLGLYMKIVTNAVMLKDENIVKKLLEYGVSHIALSIHGVDRDTYFNNTQTDNLSSVLRALSNIQQYNIEYTTLTTINRLNSDRVFDIALFLHEYGVKNIVFNIAVPTSKEKEQNYALSLDKIAQTIEDNYTLLKNKGVKVGFYASVPLCLFGENKLNAMLKDNYLIPLSKGGCNIYDSSGFAIDPHGRIIPCCKKQDSILLETMGDNGTFLYARKFALLWDSIKNHFGSETLLKPYKKCDICLKKDLCIGGCHLFWDFDDSSSYNN